MKIRTLSAVVASLLAAPLLGQTGDSWDGLVKVRSPRADAVFLAPGADFRSYTKVMLGPTEIAFRRNFQRDYNRNARAGTRISDEDAAAIADAARQGFEEIFAREYREAGYQIVDQAAPDVLLLRTAVANLYIAAPERMTAGRSSSYSYEAGEATLVLEARDSVSRAVLGRAIDSRLAGDAPGVRTQVSNRADFEALFRTWARASIRGFETLKAESPVAEPAG